MTNKDEKRYISFYNDQVNNRIEEAKRAEREMLEAFNALEQARQQAVEEIKNAFDIEVGFCFESESINEDWKKWKITGFGRNPFTSVIVTPIFEHERGDSLMGDGYRQCISLECILDEIGNGVENKGCCRIGLKPDSVAMLGTSLVKSDEDYDGITFIYSEQAKNFIADFYKGMYLLRFLDGSLLGTVTKIGESQGYVFMMNVDSAEIYIFDLEYVDQKDSQRDEGRKAVLYIEDRVQKLEHFND